MNKLVILNTTHFANKGSMGRIEGMIRSLEETIPGSQITILHRYYKQDKDTLAKQLVEKYPNLEVKVHPWFRETNSNVLTAISSLIRFCFSTIQRSILYKLGRSLNDPLKQYDAIVDLNLIEPDRLTDEYDLVSTVGNLFGLLNIWYATMTKKPVIVCSATIGPYQNKFLRGVAKHVLNKVNIITLREDYSRDYLQNLGVDKSDIYLSADLAFLMEPSNTEKIPRILENMNITSGDGPLVGMALTAMMHSALKQPQYIQLIAELTDFLIDDLNATIIYITNTYQDAPITQKTYQKVKNKHKVRILPFNVSASETKGIIGICDVFICSRFHALVASTSLAVPSLGIVAYSRNKFHGVIGKMMGQEDYLLDVDDEFEYETFLAELKSKAKDLWMNRNLVAENLKERTKVVRERTLLNGTLIKELIDPRLAHKGLDRKIRMNKEVDTIEKIAQNGLCTNCGTCAGICPENAIRMDKDYSRGCYYPKLDDERCNNCGLCFRVCPGHSVDFKALNLDIFCKKPEDILMGNYQSCYLAHATDNNLRYNAASGGVVTALLLFALEKGIIDGALVTRMKKDNPLEPEPFIARTKEEIIDASKSKYCPVPANIALKEILNSKDGEKFAVVGLPCHIHGIRKAEQTNKTLKDKILLHLGIFCSHSDTFWQTEFLLKKIGLKEKDIAKIDYRGEGWPGMMSILLKNGKKVSVPYSEVTSLHGVWLHALLRCALCCDLTSELADVSCGDAWLPEILANEKMGKSIIVSRTKIGEALCLEAIRYGYIKREEVSSYKVKQSGDMMRTKKKDINVRFFIRRLFNRAIPTYNTTLLRPGPINYLRGALVYLNAEISSKRYLRRFIGPLSRIELGLISCLRRVRG